MFACVVEESVWKRRLLYAIFWHRRSTNRRDSEFDWFESDSIIGARNRLRNEIVEWNFSVEGIGRV